MSAEYQVACRQGDAWLFLQESGTFTTKREQAAVFLSMTKAEEAVARWQHKARRIGNTRRLFVVPSERRPR
jgi:hypothetical protein